MCLYSTKVFVIKIAEMQTKLTFFIGHQPVVDN